MNLPMKQVTFNINELPELKNFPPKSKIQNPQTANSCRNNQKDWQKNYERRHLQRVKKLIKNFEKDNKDTERVRNLKNKQFYFRSKYTHEKDYDKGVVERIALERKQNQNNGSQSSRIYIEGKSLPPEMKACEKPKYRYYYWG